MWIKKVVAIACLLAAGVVAVEGDAKHASILDGKPKSFVVVGYSTSFMWPTMLQFMLDGHAEEAGVYPVMNAVVGGSPVVNWLKGHKRYGKTYGKLVSNYLSDDAEKLVGRDRPTVALCQQSLQGAFGERAAGIRGIRVRRVYAVTNYSNTVS